MQTEALCGVLRSEALHGIGRHLRRKRDLGHNAALRAAEAKLAAGLSIQTDVMSLTEPDPAAREAAASVAVVERSS